MQVLGVGIDVVAHVVVEEVVGVGEVLVVEEDLVGVSIREEVRDEEASVFVMKKTSVVARQRSPKTLSPFSCTGLEEARFRRPTVPARGARRKTGWGRSGDCSVLWKV